MLVMAKTPFPRKHSNASMDEDAEEDEDFEDVFSPPPPQSRQPTGPRQNFIASETGRSNFDKDPIEIKKVSNALPVVNKMSQQIYADHQSQAPAKGKNGFIITHSAWDQTWQKGSWGFAMKRVEKMLQPLSSLAVGQVDW